MSVVVLMALTEEVHVCVSLTEYTQDLFVVRPEFLCSICRRHRFAGDLVSLIHIIMRRPYNLSAGLLSQNAPLPGFFDLFVSFCILSLLAVSLSWCCNLWSTSMAASDTQSSRCIRLATWEK